LLDLFSGAGGTAMVQVIAALRLHHKAVAIASDKCTLGDRAAATAALVNFSRLHGFAFAEGPTTKPTLQ